MFFEKRHRRKALLDVNLASWDVCSCCGGGAFMSWLIDELVKVGVSEDESYSLRSAEYRRVEAEKERARWAL